MSSTLGISSTDAGLYEHFDLNTKGGGGDYSTVSRHYSTQPQHNKPQRHQQTESSTDGRGNMSSPVKLNFSRPFSKPTLQYRQYYQTAPQNISGEYQSFESSTGTSRPDHKKPVRDEINTQPKSETAVVVNECQKTPNSSTVRVESDLATRTSIAEMRLREEQQTFAIMMQSGEANVKPKEICTDVDAEEVKDIGDTCATKADGNHESRSDKHNKKRRRQKEKRRSRSSSTSSSSSSSTDSSSSSDQSKALKSQTHKEHKTLVQQEPAGARTASTNTCTRTVKTNPSISMRKATQAIGSTMRRTDRGVVMEDDNILVQHDSYSVVYKDTNKVFASVRAHMKLALEEVKKSISSICEAKVEDFRVAIDRVVRSETNKIRQAASKNVSRAEDTHKYVIFTPKTPEGEVFHIATAADRDDLNKKFGRCKNVDKLLLTFVNTETFGVARMRDTFKENGMTMKSKNDFSFPGVDMEDLQSYLVKIFCNSTSGTIGGRDYKISYISGERSTPVAATMPSRKRKAIKNKDAVQRSHNEEYTDPSGEDEPANERLKSKDAVEVLDEDEGRYDSGSEREITAEYSSSSEREVDNRRTVVTRKLECKRKRSKTYTNDCADREGDLRSEERAEKKRRSNYD